MTRAKYEIAGIASHVDDHDGQGEIFSRDCPEYTITTPGDERLLLVNHLKSKGFGGQSCSNSKRRRQARRIAQIYRRLVSAGQTRVAVVGDFNDTPDSKPLAPCSRRRTCATSLRTGSSHATAGQEPSVD